jgi:hypothetical protein
MTVEEFKAGVAAARKRVSTMDSIDGFKDRFLGTILAAMKAGIFFPETGAHFDAYVMLEDYIEQKDCEAHP